MIIPAICLMITELLIGLFLYNHIHSDIRDGPAPLQVTAQSQHEDNQDAAITYDLELPSPLPSPFSKPKVSAKAKSTSSIKSVQTVVLTAQAVLNSLNTYRSENGAGPLSLENKLQSYAQNRAEYLRSLGKLDKHAGHEEFMAGGGFEKLGFNSVAENQGWNYKGDATGLIESFYGKSSGHNKNQLNPEYTHVGIGIAGAFTNIVFGGRKK